jgi:KEOPS complex subunit Cgi121
VSLVEGTAEIDDLEAFLERLDAIGEAHDAAIQAFDARYVAGRAHLQRAVDLADRAVARGENVARDCSVEILLYAAGRRQIDRALEMGVGEGESPVVVVVSGGDEDGAGEAVEELLEPGEVLDGDAEVVREFFDISGAELDATDATLVDLVCERVALLDVEK